MTEHKTEIAIVGGGICGLWLLNVLRDAGYQASLFEKGQLGEAQTLASQGMIHGGIKYALGGFTTPASETIASMPALWNDCIAGNGPLDLTGLPILSSDYFLFSDGALSGKITAFFASKSLRGRISAINRTELPEAFNHPQFKGNLYRLGDIVIDTPALIKHLQHRHKAHIFHAEVSGVVRTQGRIENLQLEQGDTISADHYIFTAGSGNDNLSNVSMQRRPLKQVMLKGNLPRVYAHAVSLKDANKPRLTITTHSMPNGESVWYLGGNLAEIGVDLDDEQLIDRAKKELNELLPWIDIEGATFATLPVDRAEPAQKTGARPDLPFVQQDANGVTCWPTKLTLTPMLAAEVQKLLPAPNHQRTLSGLQLPLATVSKTPWEIAFGFE